MHDYDLNRLNTRSFEQLIQALAIEVIGPGLMVFGDGPDGGREATFEGQLTCAPSAAVWNGFGILQAKFRQQPDSEPRKNADWVIEQLRAEFKKFGRRPTRKLGKAHSKRICPQYYLFATNVSLSSVPMRGGKDRVRALLDSYKESHGLKDYVIWDGDQIRRFLDTKPGIRTTYSAWLLPGDVLSEMMKVLRLDDVDFPSVMRRYLESELLDDQFARLGQGGYTDAKNIPLSTVFIDVPIEAPKSRPDGQRPTFLHAFFEESRHVLKPSARGKAHRDPTAGRLVLIGGPGQGKTTVGQYACQLHRAELLRATNGPFSPEVEQALNRVERGSKGVAQVSARRYPLRVDLKNVAAALAFDATDRATNLFDYLLKRIGLRTNSKVRAQDLRAWLAGYPWLLVLDGLDEVPTSSNRQQLMQAIRDFISVEAHDLDADLLVLATTRPQGYSDEFDPSFYHHIALAPLNAAEALTYGSLLADARHPGQRTRFEELTSSLTRATKNEATVRLMQSPLQVTIMLALIEGGGEPPEQRWKLFHDYYNVIYRREKERGTAYSIILGRYEPDIHWIHKRAGWILQQRNAEPGRTGDRLSHAEFEAIADHRLVTVGHKDDLERQHLVLQIRRAATDRLVLLVGATENEIGFEIRSLQEFMAAEHSFDGGESCVQKTLHAIAPYSYWRNVFMFIAGRIFFERQELIDTLISVLWKMNEEGDPSFKATLAGSRLAVGLLKDGAARNQPGATRVIARCAAFALDLRDFELTRSFADVFSGHAEEVLKPELMRRLSDSVGLFPEHNWFVCFWLREAGRPWAHDATSNFPFSHEGTRRLIDHFGELLPPSFWRALGPHVFRHPLSTFMRIMRMQLDSRPETVVMPKALHQFVDIIRLGDERCRVSILWGDRQLEIEAAYSGQQNIEAWRRLDYRKIELSNAHPTWRIYHAVSEFARNPSLSSLQSQLYSLATADTDSDAARSVILSMPWQIAAAIGARRSGMAWAEVIKKISAGCMGNEADWQRWETQIKSGVPFHDLRVTDKLTVADDRKGLIFGSSPWLFTRSADPIKLVREMIAAIREWPQIGPKQALIDLCCFLLQEIHHRRHLGSISRPPLLRQVALIAVRDVIEACKDLELELPSSILYPLILSEGSVDEKRQLLIDVGQQRLQQTWYWYPGIPGEIEDRLGSELHDLLACDDQANVLRALSFLPPLAAMRQLDRLALAGR